MRNPAIRFRLHPFLADAALTGLTQILILLSSLWLVSLVSRWMGVVALGEYLLLKRVSAWLMMATQLGLGVALPREIARTSLEGPARGRQYFAAAFVALVPALVVVSIAGVLAALPLARLAFGSADKHIVYALLFFIAGSALQTLVFAYYRGQQRMRFANLVQIGGLAIVPVAALFCTRNALSAPLVIEVTGIAMAAASLLWSLPILLRTLAARAALATDARRLLTYGLPRVPADLALGGLLTLGPVLLAHTASMEQVSYYLLGVTSLTMVCLAFWPVVMMLLAKISSHLAAGRAADVIEYVQHLRSAVVQLSFLALTQGLIFAAPMIRWWLGDKYLAGVPVICILLAGTPAYLYYYSMRSVLDAASDTPYNTYNLLAALGVFLAGSLALIRFAPAAWIAMGVPAVLTLSLYLLAFATDRSLYRAAMARQTPSARALWVVGVLAAISLAAQWASHFEIGKLALVVALLFNAAIGFLLLKRARPEWVEFLSRVAFSRA